MLAPRPYETYPFHTPTASTEPSGDLGNCNRETDTSESSSAALSNSIAQNSVAPRPLDIVTKTVTVLQEGWRNVIIISYNG